MDTTAPVFSSGLTGGVAIGSSRVETVYNANVIDNGQPVDFGVIYTLGGTDAGFFSINSVGAVRYRQVQNAEVTHQIDIIATDRVGNSATRAVTIVVLPAPMVTITDSFGGEYANGDHDPYLHRHFQRGCHRIYRRRYHRLPPTAWVRQ